MSTQIIGLAGKCIDVRGRQSSNGASIVLHELQGGLSQQWLLTPEGFIVSSLDTNKCLDIAGGVPNNGTPIILFDKHGGNNQRWRHEANGCLTSFLDNNKCIDVRGAVSDDGTPIILWEKNGGKNQQWRFEALNTPQTSTLPIIHEEKAKISTGRFMESKVTMYKNGYLQVESFTKSEQPFMGLRGWVTVSCINAKGELIYFTDLFNCTTRGGVLDPSCPSEGWDTFVQKLPDVVGQETVLLDITQKDNSMTDVRTQLKNMVQLALDTLQIIGPLADEMERLVKKYQSVAG